MSYRPSDTSSQGQDPSFQQEIDSLRNRLNESLAEQRYDDAVEAARELRDRLRGLLRPDARQLKSLVGAESVLRRFAEKGSTKVTKPGWTRWLYIGISVALVLFVAVFLLVLSRSGVDPYKHDVERAIEALDRLDGAVTRGVTLRDYQSYVNSARDACSALLDKYKSEKKRNLVLRAVASSLSLYTSVLAEWATTSSGMPALSPGASAPTASAPGASAPTASAPGASEPTASVPGAPASGDAGENAVPDKKDSRGPILGGSVLSTSDAATSGGFSRLWLAAHTIEVCAITVMRREKPAATADRSTTAGRLAGHWSDGNLDIYYGPLNPSTGMGWVVRTGRDSPMEAGAYELASTLPGALSSSNSNTWALTAKDKNEVDIVRYMPQPSKLQIRVMADRYSESNTSVQLLRMDDKTLP